VFSLLRSRPVPLASFTAVMGILGTGLDLRLTGASGYAARIAAESVVALGLTIFFLLTVARVCWVALLPLVVYRLIIVKPRLPRKIAPQLAIVVESPAVIANAWFVLNGGRVDDLFKILACASLFFALLTIRTWRLAWGEPFNVAMWGWTFPAAALAGSFERIAHGSPSFASATLALILLWLAICITAACATGVVRGWLRDAEKILVFMRYNVPTDLD
jgi:tellurite resistance protein TehA-like permease